MKYRNILLPVIFLLSSTFGTLTFSCNRKENYKVINNIAMNENQFWNLIENTKSRSSNDYQRQVLLLEELLSTNDLDPVEFNAFFQELINKAYDWKLWAASYI